MKKIVKPLILIVWMAIIFYLSSQDGQTSGELSGGLLVFIFGQVEEGSILYVLIRKFAHVFLFFVLAILADINFKPYSKNHFVYAFVLTVLYCISDEIHQTFVPGRACMITDMLIDSGGALLALLLKSLLSKRKV